ncbi:hypothetical protein A9K55_008787 [Cordyceps militaris]|uniref:Kinase-like domain n=1 Tax=Cordyceps militaris TaxID=73501 RepID=A0A2H4SFF0_CORMI|nr:hypothetical protein A9K55_008787 [Cordyceps militaris]
MDYRLEQLNAGPDGAHVLASWLGMLFSVSINVDAVPACATHDTPSQRMCRLVQRLQDTSISDDEYDVVSQHLFQQIAAAGGSLLRRIVTNHRARPVSPCLADHLFLPIPFLRLLDSGSSSAGRLALAPSANKYFPERVRHAHPGAEHLPFAIDPSLPAYGIDEVHVLESLVHDPLVDHVACRVRVRGEQLFCKAERGGVAFGDSVVGRDLRTMLELRAALLRGEAAAAAPPPSALLLMRRVPGLRGVLRHPDEGHVVGFLRDWVPGASLGSYDVAELPVEVRAAWDGKVAGTLAELHRLGIYWGAAESESVIIDPHGEPWVVDFGAKVNLGLKREEEDREEGDWLDYDSVYRFLETGEELVPCVPDADESSSDDGSVRGDGGTDWYEC